MADDAQGQDGISQYFTKEGYNAQVLRWPDVERRVGLGLSGAQVIERGPGYSPSYTGAGRLGEKRGQWQNGAGHATAPPIVRVLLERESDADSGFSELIAQVLSSIRVPEYPTASTLRGQLSLRSSCWPS